MPVTITDISRELGISVSTVSKALNGYADVAEETRQRVQRAARELGYHPNTAARNLRRQRSDKLGVVFNNPLSFLRDYLVEVLTGAAVAAEESGYNLVLYTTATHPKEVLRVCRSQEVDGMLVIWAEWLGNLADELQREKMPFVVLGQRVNRESVSFVAPDNRQGGLLLFRHLVGLGHRRIGFMARPERHTTHQDRLDAYRQVLEEHDLPFDDSLVVDTQIRPDSGTDAMEQLLDLPNPPTAVVGFHDGLAVEALRQAHRRQLRVPDDVAIAGFDDLRPAALAEPPITTVRQPMQQMGQKALESLLQQVVEPDSPPERLIFPVELVVRASTAG